MTREHYPDELEDRPSRDRVRLDLHLAEGRGDAALLAWAKAWARPLMEALEEANDDKATLRHRLQYHSF